MKIDVAKPYFDVQEQQAAAEVIASGWVSQGSRVSELEKIFSEYVGAKYAVATTSATTALHAALSVSGIGDGDEVVVPSLSFIATANCVRHCGARPVFVDIDPETCNIDPSGIECAITERTRAIIPVHQMGLPADLNAIKEISEKYGLTIVEDAACAIGSEYQGRRIGGHGNIACYSFHPRKIITTGEGGMITTDNFDHAEKLRRFRSQGMSVSDLDRHNADDFTIESYIEVGYNYRMTDIQAAIGIVQMQKLPEILDKRRSIARKYNEAFSKNRCLRVPLPPPSCFHNYQSYWVEVTNHSSISRNDLIRGLLHRGISTRRGIMAIHKEPCYRDLYDVSLPQTEKITSETIILPLYPAMTDEEVQFVIDSIFEVFQDIF